MSERWDILIDIAKAISTSPFSYRGDGEFNVEADKWLTRDEYWDTLDEEAQQKILRASNAAYETIGRIGLHVVMQSAYEDYLSEK